MAKTPKDTNKLPINQNYFTGGVSIDPKLAIANAFFYSQNLDFRSKPSQISVLPGPTTLRNNLPDLITAMDQDLNGVRWAVGNKGSIYKIDTSNNISQEAVMTENGSAGMLYNQVTDQLYVPGTTSVSMFGQVTTGNTGNPQFRNAQFGPSASTAPGCVNLYNTSDGFFDGATRNTSQSSGVGITTSNINSQVQTNTTSTYTLPTTVLETSGNFCFFSPDIEPFHSIWVYIKTVGTGNWTLTLHDSLNTPLASVTVSNASLTAGQYNQFAFGKQIRALVNASQTGFSATYHFHLTSSVIGDTATAGSVNTGDLSSADFLLFAYRLVQTSNGWHPTTLFTGSGQPLLCIGNGQYLSTYNFGNDSNPTNGQWQRHNLVFKQGYEVCGLTNNNQYLVVAVERRSNNANRNFQQGGLYFWDGSTNAPNFYIDIPMGAPYGVYTFNNVTYFAVAGSLYAWSGGQTVIKVRKLAYQNTDYLGAVDSTIINPNMFTTRYNLLMMGYPSSTTNPNINYGVWSWGSVELMFPNSYGLSYTLASGILNNNTSGITNLQIGSVYNFVDSMYISWSYTKSGVTSYGLDLVNNFSSPASSFNWQSLIYDGGVRYKEKMATRLKINFFPLPANTTLSAQYSIDRGVFVTSDPSSGLPFTAKTGDTSLTVEMNNARFHELQWGFLGTTSGATTAPTITGVVMEVDPLSTETEVRQENPEA